MSMSGSFVDVEHAVAKGTTSPSEMHLEQTKDTSTPTNGNADNDESEDDIDDEQHETGDGAAKKKKKRKPRKKKKTGANGTAATGTGTATKQSEPPRVPVSQLFREEYPVGEEVEYKDDNSYRSTNEEKRYLDRMNNDFLQEYRLSLIHI